MQADIWSIWLAPERWRDMARITLKNLKHAYMPNPVNDEDWALKELNLDWDDGGARRRGGSVCGFGLLEHAP